MDLQNRLFRPYSETNNENLLGFRENDAVVASERYRRVFVFTFGQILRKIGHCAMVKIDHDGFKFYTKNHLGPT